MAAGRRFRIRAADRDIADFLVRKGILTPKELEEANRLQWSRANNWGDLPPLSSVLRELKFLPPPDLLGRLERESTYSTKCDTCGSELTIPFFDPDRAYLCHQCKAMLMTFEVAPDAPLAGASGVEEVSEEEPSAQDIPPPVAADADLEGDGSHAESELPAWMADDVGGDTLLDASPAKPAEEVATPRASTEDTLLELGPVRAAPVPTPAAREELEETPADEPKPDPTVVAGAEPGGRGLASEVELPSWMDEKAGEETLLDARAARPSEEVVSPRASTGEDTILELGPTRTPQTPAPVAENSGGSSPPSEEPGGQGITEETVLPEWMNEKAGEDTLLDAGAAARSSSASPPWSDDEGVDIDVEPEESPVSEPTVLAADRSEEATEVLEKTSEEITVPAAADEPTDIVDLVPDELTTEPEKIRGEEPGSLGFGAEAPLRDWMEEEVLQPPRMKKAPEPPAEDLASLPKAAGEDSLLDIGAVRGKTAPAAPVEPEPQKTVEVALPSAGPYEATVIRHAPPPAEPVPAVTRSDDDPPEIEEAPVPDYYEEESAILEIPLPTLETEGTESTLILNAQYKDLARAWGKIAHRPKQLRPPLPELGSPPPREPKSTSTTTDFTIMVGETPGAAGGSADTATGATIVVGDSATSTGTTISLTDPGGKGVTKTDATLLVGEGTAGPTPASRTTATGGTLPLTGGRAGIAGKALPAEVKAASKDEKRIFGKYVLVKELGRGGAGVVYKAWDTLLTQYVAIKFLRDQDFAEDESATTNKMIEDFQHEARMSAKLRHPNIVRIYEMGCMSNRYYLSMEYIDGGSFFEVIHGGKERNTRTMYHTNPDKFLALVRDVALAVDHAHKQDPPVVHRDLKPHNVLLDQKGMPFVADFGLAKEVEFGSSQGQTVTGVVKGTPSYMAPEQAEGKSKDVDGRTDVYSLGAILYEAITGVPPFIGDNIRAVLNRIVHEEPVRPNDAIAKIAQEQPDASNPAQPVPKALETICLKALEKRKADRYQSAKEFADDLERFRLAEEILAKEPGVLRKIKRKILARPVLSGSIAAVLMAALAVFITFKVIPKSPVNIAELVQRGGKHQKDGEWAALRVVVEDLRKHAPKNASIPGFEKAIADHEKAVREHEAFLAKSRKDWTDGMERLRTDLLKDVLEVLRPTYRACPDLHGEFRESLRPQLESIRDKASADARRILGSGPRSEWVDEKLKKEARAVRGAAATLLGLSKDKEFPFQAESVLAGTLEGLDRAISYLGTWTLRANVVPYAEVTLLRDGKEAGPPEFTPLGRNGLEVFADDYTVELCWPSRQDPQVKVVQQITGLKNEQTVLIRGDMSRKAITQERR